MESMNDKKLSNIFSDLNYNESKYLSEYIGDLKRRLKSEQQEKSKMNYHIETLQNDLVREQQSHNNIKEKLKKIEFKIDYSSGILYCPVCENSINTGHTDECWLSQQIKEESKLRRKDHAVTAYMKQKDAIVNLVS